jgi:hypothetical protein
MYKDKSEPEAIPLKVTDANQYQTVVSVPVISADSILVAYTSLPSNRPNTYGNYVAIWQNANQIPWDQDPLKLTTIPSDQQRGNVLFDGLTIEKNDYILGYGVGPAKADSQKYGNICSTIYLPMGSDTDPSGIVVTLPSLVLKFVGQNAVMVQFNMPSNYTPATNKAWMGLWRGAGTSYRNPPDTGAVPVTVNANTGTGGFNNVPLGVGLDYTIAFFMSGWNSDPTQRNQKVMACTMTFSV